MEISFIETLLYNMLMHIVETLSATYVVMLLLKRSVDWKKTWFPFLIYIVVWSGVMTSVTYGDVLNPGYIMDDTYLVVVIVSSILSLLYFKAMFPRDDISVLFAADSVVGILSDIFLQFWSLTGLFIQYTFKFEIHFLIYVLVIHLMPLGICIVFTKRLRKIKFLEYFRFVLENKKIGVSSAIIYCIIDYFIYFFAIRFREGINHSDWSMLSTIVRLVYVLIYILLGLVVREIYNKQKIRQADALILQQQNYLNRLEGIQQNIRLIQHDYKNMISGMYAKVTEGHLEEVKDYIDSKLLQVDQEVSRDIKEMSQLTQIKLAELRGLLLTKMMIAQSKKIPFQLEVLNAVDEIYIKIDDLLRSLGILLDNAIEEAETAKNPSLTLVILKEENKISILVKNAAGEKSNFLNIWKDGYSTKGKNRGLGLTSFKKILEKYDNVAQETKIEGDQFTQVLMIMDCGES